MNQQEIGRFITAKRKENTKIRAKRAYRRGNGNQLWLCLGDDHQLCELAFGRLGDPARHIRLVLCHLLSDQILKFKRSPITKKDLSAENICQEVFFHISKPKRPRQKLAERGFKEILLCTRAKHGERLLAKFIKHLTANAAGRGVRIRGTCHRDGNEIPLSLGDRLGKRASLRAKRGRIGGIFNIASRIHPSACRKERRADGKF